MKKIVSLLAAALLAAASLGAQPAAPWPSMAAELSAALEPYEGTDVGDLTVGDLQDMAARRGMDIAELRRLLGPNL